jgi:hypothetical protein
VRDPAHVKCPRATSHVSTDTAKHLMATLVAHDAFGTSSCQCMSTILLQVELSHRSGVLLYFHDFGPSSAAGPFGGSFLQSSILRHGCIFGTITERFTRQMYLEASPGSLTSGASSSISCRTSPTTSSDGTGCICTDGAPCVQSQSSDQARFKTQ